MIRHLLSTTVALGILILEMIYFASPAAAQEQLLASDGAPEDRFGYRVDISADGNTALVGAEGHHHSSSLGTGTAYIFSRLASGSWSSSQELEFPYTIGNEFFGWKVALSGSGEIAVVGAYNSETAAGCLTLPTPCKGSADIFARNPDGTWSHQQRLLPPNGAAGRLFGVVAVSHSGNTIIVGDWGADSPEGPGSGAAYVFVRLPNATWIHQPEFRHRLDPPSGGSSSLFGYSVGLSAAGDIAVIGAPYYDDANADNSGAVFVYSRAPGGSWSYRQPAEGSRFGFAVSISDDGNTAIVASPDEETDAGVAAGSAHLFIRGSSGVWSYQASLFSPIPAPGDYFGLDAVALSADGNIAAVGSTGANPDGIENAGAAFIFHRSADLTWSFRQTYVAPNKEERDLLGSSVSLSNSGLTTIVGAISDNTPLGTNTGSAFVFTENDRDFDGISDESDNCIYDSNPMQSDADSDGVGDICDFELTLWSYDEPIECVEPPRPQYLFSAITDLANWDAVSRDQHPCDCFGIELPLPQGAASIRFSHMGPDSSVTSYCENVAPYALGLSPGQHICSEELNLDGLHSVTATPYTAYGCDDGIGSALPTSTRKFWIAPEPGLASLIGAGVLLLVRLSRRGILREK
jgi:hypothetical protein